MTQLELEIPSGAARGVAAVGNFDGVHLGHQQMLQQIRDEANRRQAPSVVLTFDPHPVTVLRPEIQLPRLTTIPDRIRLLKKHGADHVVVLPATESLLQMTATRFFEEVIVKQLNAVAMVEGPDFRFGRNREGDTVLLDHLCRARGIGLKIIKCIQAEGKQVSSTRLRTAISAGNLTLANQLLNRPYAISGLVVPGAARGRKLGFPTANLSQVPMLVPPDGVYAGVAEILERTHGVAVNIGPNPTFQDGDRKIECHVLDFDGDLYGQTLSVNLLRRIRGLTQFSSADKLVDQIGADLVEIRHEVARDSVSSN